MGRRGIGRIIATFFQIMLLVGWTSSRETEEGGANKSGNVKHVSGEFELGWSQRRVSCTVFGLRWSRKNGWAALLICSSFPTQPNIF